MSNHFKTRVCAIFGATVMTVAVFTGTGAAADQQVRVAAENVAMARGWAPLALTVQYVTVVGHRQRA